MQNDVNWRYDRLKSETDLKIVIKPRNCLDLLQIVFLPFSWIFNLKWDSHYFFTHDPNLKGIQKLKALIEKIRLYIMIPMASQYFNDSKA